MNLIETLERMAIDARVAREFCDEPEENPAELFKMDCEAIETVRAMQEALSDLTENGLGTASVRRAREALRRAEGNAG